MKTACLLVLLLPALCRAEIAVTGDTTILIDSREPSAIQRAARDLAADMQAVFGRPARIVHSSAEASATRLVIAFEHNLPKGVRRPVGWETLRLEVVGKAVVLTGSDPRGVIYAIYEFSRQFLKVDPFYWWTDNPPARRERVMIGAGLAEQQGPPTFHYRGWFLNDEDLLTAWRPGTADGTGISLEVWDRIYETLLRLKADMVIPGTFLFPDEPQMKAATARGLILSQHHMEPLGLNVYQWPAGRPYTFDLLLDAWRCNVSRFPTDAEIVWTVGLRGRYDNPFWLDTPEAPKTPERQAELIRSAIGKQMEIVRAGRKEASPDFILNTWMEGTRLVRAGALKIPEGVHLVWADDGAGTIQDGGLMRPGDGVYYHTAVVGGNANNFTERVPLTRIEHELARAARAGATHYLLLNPSDVLPVSLTSRAVMEAGWDAKPWQADGYSSKFLEEWSRQEFGPRAGPLVARFYEAYFEAPARYATRNHFEMGDNFYQQVARDLLLRIVRGQQTADHVIEPDTTTPEQLKSLGGTYREYLDGLQDSCRQAETRWAAAAGLAAEAEVLAPAGRLDFFRAHVLAQLAVQRNSNRMLEHVAAAALPHLAQTERLARVRLAIEDVRRVQQALEAAGYGRWRGFYTKGDWFVNVPLTAALAEVCRKRLEGGELSPADQETIKTADHYINANTADVFIKIKAYQGTRKVEFCRP